MNEVEVGGHKYRVGKLDARQQIHIWRRLAPVVTAMGGIAGMRGLIPAAGAGGETEGVAGASDGEDAPGMSAETVMRLAAMVEPVLDVIARLPDHEVDYLIDHGLRVCMRQVDGDRGWAPVAPNGAVMFDDIGPLHMLELAARAIIGEAGAGGLGDFFSTSPRP